MNLPLNGRHRWSFAIFSGSSGFLFGISTKAGIVQVQCLARIPADVLRTLFVPLPLTGSASHYRRSCPSFFRDMHTCLVARFRRRRLKAVIGLTCQRKFQNV